MNFIGRGALAKRTLNGYMLEGQGEDSRHRRRAAMSRQASQLLSRHRPLCALYAREARDLYPGRRWEDIEPNVRRAWERSPKRLAWKEAAPLVRRFWSLS